MAKGTAHSFAHWELSHCFQDRSEWDYGAATVHFCLPPTYQGNLFVKQAQTFSSFIYWLDKGVPLVS